MGETKKSRCFGFDFYLSLLWIRSSVEKLTVPPAASASLVSRELAHKSINVSRLSVVPGKVKSVRNDIQQTRRKKLLPIATLAKLTKNNNKQTSLISGVLKRNHGSFSKIIPTSKFPWEVMIPKADWSGSCWPCGPAVPVVSLTPFWDKETLTHSYAPLQQVFDCISALHHLKEQTDFAKEKRPCNWQYIRDDEL